MFYRSSNKTGTLSGLNSRETSWRTYSKTLIVELKEKLADRRARTLALVSENRDLAAFNEIDTESDGLDDTSTNVTSFQEVSAKDGATFEERPSEQNSLSEATSLTESDFHDMEVQNDESKRSLESSHAGNSRCCSGSCSSITTVSGGSYTSEDVSSRSLDDFVAEMNPVDITKEGNSPRLHKPYKYPLCQEQTNTHEICASVDNASKLNYQPSLDKLDELKFTEKLLKSSSYDKYSTGAIVSQLYVNVENKSELRKARSDSSFCVGTKSVDTEMHAHGTVAGLLMISVLRNNFQTNCTYRLSRESSSSLGSFSSRPIQDYDSNRDNDDDDRKVGKDVIKLMKQSISDNLITISGEQDSDNNGDKRLGSENLCLLEEKYVDVEEWKEHEIVTEELERDMVMDKELARDDKVADEIEKEEIAGKKEVEKRNEESKILYVEEKEEHAEIAKKEEEIKDEQDEEEHLQYVEEKIFVREEHAPNERTFFKFEQTGNNHNSSQSNDGASRLCGDKLPIAVIDEERVLVEENFSGGDSNESDVSSRREKLQSETYTLTTDDVCETSFSHIKDLINQLVEVFESNTEFYKTIDRRIVSRFQDHSAYMSMLISVYENKSGNSGYTQTSNTNSEDFSPQTERNVSVKSGMDASQRGDRSRSLQTCLEKAKLASSLKIKIGSGRRGTDNTAAIKVYDKTVNELEKYMLEYLEIYSKEAVAERKDKHIKVSQRTNEPSELSDETIAKSRHAVLRRSDTFVVKEKCCDKPPSIAKRRNSPAKFATENVTSKQINKGDVDEEADVSRGEEADASLIAPHSSPTFLITDDFWNTPINQPDTFKTDQNNQDKAGKNNKNQADGVTNTAVYNPAAGERSTQDNQGYESDTSESLYDGKETEKMTYTSSMLAQLLDYNSADESRTFKRNSELKTGLESIKNHVGIKNDESCKFSEMFFSKEIKHNKTCTRDCMNEDLFIKEGVTSNTEVRKNSEKYGENENIEKYNFEVDYGDRNYLNQVLPAQDLKLAVDPSYDIPFNEKSEQSSYWTFGNEVQREERESNFKSLARDEVKIKEENKYFQNDDCKPSSTTNVSKEAKDCDQNLAQLRMSKVTNSQAQTGVHNQEISPLGNTLPEAISGQTVCCKQLPTSATSSEFSRTCIEHHIEREDRQLSHQMWKQPIEDGDDAVEDQCPDPLVSMVDWSSSDEDVDAVQRDASPSDLLRLKQKRDVNEKLLQLGQSGSRRRKSRSPLCQKISTDIPRFKHSTESYQTWTITPDISNQTVDTHKREFGDVDTGQEVKHKPCRQNQSTSLSEQIDTDITVLKVNTTEEGGDTGVLKSASQLMHARIQEEQYGLIELNEKQEDSLGKHSKSAMKYESAMKVKNLRLQKHTHSLKPSKDEFLISRPGNEFQRLSTNSRNVENTLPVSQDYTVGQSVLNNKSEETHKASPTFGRPLEVSNDEMLSIHSEQLSNCSFLESFIGAVNEYHSPKCREVSQENGQKCADNSNPDIDQISKDRKGDNHRFVKSDRNVGIDEHFSYQKIPENDRIKEVSLELSTSCDTYIPLNESHVNEQQSFNCDDPEWGKAPATKHQREDIDSTFKGDCKWKSIRRRKIELFNSNPVKAYSQLSPLQYNETSKIIGNEKVAGLKINSIGSCPDLAAGVDANIPAVYNSDQTISRPSESLDGTQTPTSDFSSEYLFLKDEAQFDKNIRKENKNSDNSITSELYKQNMHSQSSSHAIIEQIQDKSLAKRTVRVRQVSLNEPLKSSLEKTVQEDNLNKHHPPLENRSEPRKSRCDDMRMGYEAIEALRNKVSRLEQMLEEENISQDKDCRRNKNFTPKKTTPSSKYQNNCFYCQHMVRETSPVHIRSQSNILRPCCQGRMDTYSSLEQLPASNFPQRLLCNNQFCQYSQTEACWCVEMGRRIQMDSKECQTSGDVSLCNLKPKTGSFLDSWTQKETPSDFTVCQSLENHFAGIQQEVRELRQAKEFSNNLMMELDGKMKHFIDDTSTILAGHSRQMESTHVILAEGFKNVQDELQDQREKCSSVREYINGAEENLKSTLQLLSSQQLDVMTRSVQTMEERLCPIQESLLTQGKEIEDIRSSLNRVVTCLEDRCPGQTKRGMSYDTLKERIVELTTQRDAEKVFHRITRQSLRALERDHDRLRQEYIQATYRRNNHNECSSQHRLWYCMNNQDKCQQYDNNYSNIRNTQETLDKSDMEVPEETHENTHPRHRKCDRHGSSCRLEKLDQGSQRLPHRSCPFAEGKSQVCLHDKILGNPTREDSSSQNKMGTVHEVTGSTDNRISFSDHSQNLACAHTSMSSSVGRYLNNEDFPLMLKQNDLTIPQAHHLKHAMCSYSNLYKISTETRTSCEQHDSILNKNHFGDD